MTFDEIETLILHNNDIKEWHTVKLDKTSFAYCLEDVHLQLSTSIVKVGGIQRLQIQILYAATIIMSFLVPPGAVKRPIKQIDFDEVLGLCVEHLKNSRAETI